MFGHFKKSASILTDQDTQMVGNDRWPATICNAGIQSLKLKILSWIYDTATIIVYVDGWKLLLQVC